MKTLPDYHMSTVHMSTGVLSNKKILDLELVDFVNHTKPSILTNLSSSLQRLFPIQGDNIRVKFEGDNGEGIVREKKGKDEKLFGYSQKRRNVWVWFWRERKK
nr:hypothetical protein Iba_chr14bCG9050 [Ipomoea batatas]